MAKSRDEYRVLVGKPERKRPLERHKHSWEYNIKMDYPEGDGGHRLD
jgi:hypothetical protein